MNKRSAIGGNPRAAAAATVSQERVLEDSSVVAGSCPSNVGRNITRRLLSIQYVLQIFSIKLCMYFTMWKSARY
jgi:hypothetical protein